MEYIIIITILGFAALGMAWMPRISSKINVSYSILYVLLGVILYSLLDMLPRPDPFVNPEFTVRITELVVIVSLMGTGLKIDEPFSLKTWRIPFKLVSITMLLSIALVSWIAWQFLGLDIASSVLLGAALAPTDPVLAGDVQVGPPLEKSKNDVRFHLTAEAGLNDGMAFPFTWLAIVITLFSTNEKISIGEWVIFDVLYKIGAGAISGFLLGKLLAFLVFYIPEKKKFIITRDGFVAISATLLVYGLTELIHAYGFIAVFIAAITLRNYEINHKYHKKLHSFTDQIERILMAIVLILFGGTLVNGVLQILNWQMILFGIGFIFLIRPITAFIPLISESLHFKEKAAISFFGIRGMGSFFYLSFAITKANFAYAELLWATITFIVLASVLIHGVTASFIMKRLQKEFGSKR